MQLLSKLVCACKQVDMSKCAFVWSPELDALCLPNLD